MNVTSLATSSLNCECTPIYISPTHKAYAYTHILCLHTQPMPTHPPYAYTHNPIHRLHTQSYTPSTHTSYSTRHTHLFHASYSTLKGISQRSKKHTNAMTLVVCNGLLRVCFQGSPRPQAQWQLIVSVGTATVAQAVRWNPNMPTTVIDRHFRARTTHTHLRIHTRARIHPG